MKLHKLQIFPERSPRRRRVRLWRRRAIDGFTLIEMMVVIAVIGILSAAVLAGLGPSRAKARDARIISGLQQIRSIAETIYNPVSDTPYSGLETAALAAVTDIKKQNGNQSLVWVVSGYGYVVSSPLASSGSYCVDSAGYSGPGTATAGTNTCTSAAGGPTGPTDLSVAGVCSSFTTLATCPAATCDWNVGESKCELK